MGKRATDQVWSLREAQKAMATFGDVLPTRNCATWTEKFDAEFGQMEKAAEAQKMTDIAMTAACQTRSTYRRLATAFDEAELDLNGGLLKIHQLVAATASATGDRMENEHGYLENALRILNMIQKRGGGRVQTYCRDGKTNK